MQFHDVQQNEEEWETLRLGKVTASGFGAFMEGASLDDKHILINADNIVCSSHSTQELAEKNAKTLKLDEFNIVKSRLGFSKGDVYDENDTSKLFNETATRYALKVALERIKGVKSEFSFTNAHMERGHAQEPVARMLYEEQTFCFVSNGGFFDHGDYGDSPDGLADEDGVIEIKSVIAPTHYATLLRGGYDPAYKWQLIGHLDCTGRDWVDFVSYCSDFPIDNQLLIYRLKRENYLPEIELLRKRRDDFIKFVDTIVARIIQ